MKKHLQTTIWDFVDGLEGQKWTQGQTLIKKGHLFTVRLEELDEVPLAR